MRTEKLNEALIEMKRQRGLLDAAIKNIEQVLSSLSDTASEKPLVAGIRAPERSSYIDLAEQILAEAGNPMHIGIIAAKISTVRGREIPRASVESSIIRHIKAYGDKSRIIKTKPAFFGLKAWKSLFIPEPKHSAA